MAAILSHAIEPPTLVPSPCTFAFFLVSVGHCRIPVGLKSHSESHAEFLATFQAFPVPLPPAIAWIGFNLNGPPSGTMTHTSASADGTLGH